MAVEARITQQGKYLFNIGNFHLPVNITNIILL